MANRTGCLPTLFTSRRAFFVLIFAVAIYTLPTSGFLFQENIPSFGFLKSSDQDPPIHEVLFHSPKLFKLNYKKMEKKFKLHVYEEPVICEYGPAWYRIRHAREMYFRENILHSRFLTGNPEEANLFFIPIPCFRTGDPNDEGEINLEYFVSRRPYWNRTLGADHVYMTFNDTRVTPAKHAHFLMKNSIRVECSASYNASNYIAYKDISLPDIMEFDIPAGDTDVEGRTEVGIGFGDGSNVSLWKRVRKTDILLATDYLSPQLYTTKYCVCYSGDQDIGTYIALAIHGGCVPVILSEDYVLPFDNILDWSKFSVRLKEADPFRLWEILDAIPFPIYKELQENVVKVRRHFEWNSPPKKYDAFHMAMYELWLRRHAIRF